MSRRSPPSYCVIDKNAFEPDPKKPDETPELVRWLSVRRSHIAVITDYAIQESVSGDPVLNLTRSLRLLRQFPYQFVLTIPTGEACRLDLRDGDLAKLIDDKQTADFRNLCLVINRDGEIPENIKALIRSQVGDVNAHLGRLVENTGETVGHLKDLWKGIGQEDIQAICRFEQPSTHGREYLQGGTIQFAQQVQEQIVLRLAGSFNIEVRSSLTFKVALACLAQRVDQISSSPPPQIAPKNIRNNTIDANYVAYALVFGRFMSGDERAMRTYRLAKWMEKRLFAIDDLARS